MTTQTKIAFTEYRDLVQGYERLVNVDYHACVGPTEKTEWKRRAIAQFTKINAVTCCKADLVQRFESTVDRAVKNLENTIKANYWNKGYIANCQNTLNSYKQQLKDLQ